MMSKYSKGKNKGGGKWKSHVGTDLKKAIRVAGLRAGQLVQAQISAGIDKDGNTFRGYARSTRGRYARIGQSTARVDLSLTDRFRKSMKPRRAKGDDKRGVASVRIEAASSQREKARGLFALGLWWNGLTAPSRKKLKDALYKVLFKEKKGPPK